MNIRNKIRAIVSDFFTVLVVVGTFWTFLFQPFWIPSGSMKSTLLVGDFLFVNKMAYGYSYASCPSLKWPSIGVDIDTADLCRKWFPGQYRLFAKEPKRGDVVVFRHPVSHDTLIKRIIGLPGDRIEVRDGVVWLNGVALQQRYVGIFEEPRNAQGPRASIPACVNYAREAEPCYKQRLIEELPNGREYSVLNILDRAALDTVPLITVPANHYFFLGDNRDNSNDSRNPQSRGGVGFVPESALLGRADRIVISAAGSSILHFWTWRLDRILMRIS